MPRGPCRGDPLGAHPADPGGSGQRVPLAESAGRMSVGAPTRSRRRTRVRVHGTVQGVGFRPYVFRLADELGLDGFVRNDSRGVVAEVEGAPAAIEHFLA